MTKHRFSYMERYALWRAYDGQCFYCGKPLDLQDMTVDHIVPEWLAEKPDELRQLRSAYEIDDNFPGFQINDFMNWVPSHNRCNARKGGQLYQKKMTLLFLQEGHRHLAKVRSELETLAESRGRSHVLGKLSTAIERKHCTVEGIRRFLVSVERLQHACEPLVLTFGLNTDELVQSGTLPSEVPQDYPVLCDWLELDLVRRLRAVVTTPFHYTEPSDRSGETLSVRIVFPGLHDEELDHVDLDWWEILEAGTFWDIFQQTYHDVFPKLPTQEYFGDIGEAPE